MAFHTFERYNEVSSGNNLLTKCNGNTCIVIQELIYDLSVDLKTFDLRGCKS